jgi:hypothetical protein
MYKIVQPEHFFKDHIPAVRQKAKQTITSAKPTQKKHLCVNKNSVKTRAFVLHSQLAPFPPKTPLKFDKCRSIIP